MLTASLMQIFESKTSEVLRAEDTTFLVFSNYSSVVCHLISTLEKKGYNSLPIAKLSRVLDAYSLIVVVNVVKTSSRIRLFLWLNAGVSLSSNVCGDSTSLSSILRRSSCAFSLTMSLPSPETQTYIRTIYLSYTPC